MAWSFEKSERLARGAQPDTSRANLYVRGVLALICLIGIAWVIVEPTPFAGP